MENTAIAWATHTHNQWIGCSKKSEECTRCYAEVLMDQRFGRAKWGPKGTRTLTKEANRRKPLAWNRSAEKSGIRPRVFCSSLSDVFEDRPELIPWREDLFELIRQTPMLDWLLLTKRPENVVAMLPEDWGDGWPNVWIGTSAGNQRRWDERISLLREIPAVIRFVSIEPMIGPINIRPELQKGGVDWTVVGGESGRGARRMDLAWARDVRDGCKEFEIPFFFKQKGEALAAEMGCAHHKGEEPSEWPEDIRIQEFPGQPNTVITRL